MKKYMVKTILLSAPPLSIPNLDSRSAATSLTQVFALDQLPATVQWVHECRRDSSRWEPKHQSCNCTPKHHQCRSQLAPLRLPTNGSWTPTFRQTRSRQYPQGAAANPACSPSHGNLCRTVGYLTNIRGSPRPPSLVSSRVTDL